jgi:hypothetical protein
MTENKIVKGEPNQEVITQGKANQAGARAIELTPLYRVCESTPRRKRHAACFKAEDNNDTLYYYLLANLV